jgi:hypothetical protein
MLLPASDFIQLHEILWPAFFRQAFGFFATDNSGLEYSGRR